MAETMLSRFKNAWNVFLGREEDFSSDLTSYGSYSMTEARSHRVLVRQPVDRSIITSIYTRLAVDVASYDIRHVRKDSEDRYVEDMPSYLNDCLSWSANIDQTGRDLLRDAALSLMTNGVIAIVPVETTSSPVYSNSYDIQQLRVGEVKQWYSDRVRVSVYDEREGVRKEVVLLKRFVAIVENPFYSIMNEPNSTLQRLTRKLGLLDQTDEQISSGKLDLIIQLPYVIKNEARRQQAEIRRKDIEFQLMGSKYGIAYTDGTERITQLNRPVENTLLPQVKDLKDQLYNELGLTKAIMDGTADEAAMLNYFDRTIDPIIRAITESMEKVFLTKTARTQKQGILYTRDPFRIVPISQIADVADKLTRNEIASSNDIRTIIGWKPSQDPKANELRNSNMPAPDEGAKSADEAPKDPPAKEVSSAKPGFNFGEKLRALENSRLKTP